MSGIVNALTQCETVIQQVAELNGQCDSHKISGGFAGNNDPAEMSYRTTLLSRFAHSQIKNRYFSLHFSGEIVESD
jgi:hypothetical protein